MSDSMFLDSFVMLEIALYICEYY